MLETATDGDRCFEHRAGVDAKGVSDFLSPLNNSEWAVVTLREPVALDDVTEIAVQQRIAV